MKSSISKVHIVYPDNSFVSCVTYNPEDTDEIKAALISAGPGSYTRTVQIKLRKSKQVD